MRTVLMVAEKPSLAKSLALILSGGSIVSRRCVIALLLRRRLAGLPNLLPHIQQACPLSHLLTCPPDKQPLCRITVRVWSVYSMLYFLVTPCRPL